MLVERATDVRNEWSATIDSVIHHRPKLIKRTRDRMWLSSIDTMKDILSAYHFTADMYTEDDGSVTLSLNEIDLVVNASTVEEAKVLLAKDILEYAEEYYDNYEIYSRAPNRKKHIPYIFKAILADSAEDIGKDIVCQNGKN